MQIYNADFLKLDLPKESVDLIITSPPYNLGIDYGTQSDTLPYRDYLKFSQNWLTKSFSLLKDSGVICINVPLSTNLPAQAGNHSISADLTILAKRAGFKYQGTIIWNKQQSSNKYSLMFSKNVEVILIFGKNYRKPLKKEYYDWINNIWTFSGESPKRVSHPAPFPLELPRRLIKLFSDVGDTVLDPFMGSGTTILASEMYNRHGVGVEINSAFFARAKKRIEERKL